MKLSDLTHDHLDDINNILKDEYYYDDKCKIKSYIELEYQCFGKSHAIYSGYGVVKVYKYLLEQGFDISIY